MNLGLLNAKSARNIKIAEDILSALVPLPYVTDGGNLMVEFTVGADKWQYDFAESGSQSKPRTKTGTCN